MTTALSMYENSLRSRTALFTCPATGGAATRLDTERYLAGADDTDRLVLRHCVGPVLDVGCGPGRMLAACEAAGLASFGIDVAGEAIAQARAQGGRAALGDVFGSVPGEGSWGTVLLLDGNVGIGGDPERLLRRAFALLAPGGRVVVEVDPVDHHESRGHLVLVDASGDLRSDAFPWARVGTGRLAAAARRAGYVSGPRWTSAGRAFSVLVRPV